METRQPTSVGQLIIIIAALKEYNVSLIETVNVEIHRIQYFDMFSPSNIKVDYNDYKELTETQKRRHWYAVLH